MLCVEVVRAEEQQRVAEARATGLKREVRAHGGVDIFFFCDIDILHAVRSFVVTSA